MHDCPTCSVHRGPRPYVGGTTYRLTASGFTLTELLVVVAIVAILAAVVVPTLVVARRRALRVPCAANLKSLYHGLMLYQNEHEGEWPRLYSAAGALTVYTNTLYQGGVGVTGWGGLYAAELLPDPGVFWCPADTQRRPDGEHGMAKWGSPAGSGNKVVGSYTYHAFALSRYSRSPRRVLGSDVGRPKDKAVSNHRGGGNSLYADGRVEFGDRLMLKAIAVAATVTAAPLP